MAFYYDGLDVLDVYRGRLSLRKLRVLIERLPPESATKTALRNSAPTDEVDKVTSAHRPDLAPWSGTEMLLAALTDEVRLLRMVTVAAHGGKPGEFSPVPRPGIPPTSTQPKRLTDEQRRAIDPRLRDQPKEA